MAKGAGTSQFTEYTEDENDEDDGDESEQSTQDDHDEPTVPHSFLPTTLRVLVMTGVLSEEFNEIINHAIDRGEVEEG